MADTLQLTIPEWNKQKFQKYIHSLERKGLKVDVKEIGPTIQTVDGIDYRCTDYEISTEILYAENGWEFIGTIEHKSGGNIIRKIKNVKVSKRYETAPNECEHCHTIRNRIDTYLVRNTETNEFRQVGKTCLRDYTGLNPAICAVAMSLERELAAMEIDEDEVIRGGSGVYGSFIGFDAYLVKRIAYAEIKKNGYRKNTEENARGVVTHSTKSVVRNLYYSRGEVDMASDAEIAEVDEWVKNLDTNNNDYFRNASIAYNENYLEYRDIPLVVSLISCYFRDKQIQSEKAAREKARQAGVQASQEAGYAGEVGDKIEFEVVSDRILWVNDPYTYGARITHTHRITDTQGHIILWTTGNVYEMNEAGWTDNNGCFVAGIKIKATVKSHKEFRGELQTVVTRGKVLNPARERHSTAWQHVEGDNSNDNHGEGPDLRY